MLKTFKSFSSPSKFLTNLHQVWGTAQWRPIQPLHCQLSLISYTKIMFLPCWINLYVERKAQSCSAPISLLNGLSACNFYISSFHTTFHITNPCCLYKKPFNLRNKFLCFLHNQLQKFIKSASVCHHSIYFCF